jgi:hypothetical protein
MVLSTIPGKKISFSLFSSLSSATSAASKEQSDWA